MWRPVDIDGRTVVILEERPGFLGGYLLVESGRLSYDGQELTLISDQLERRITEEELQSFKPVSEANRIAACRGFDFFVIRSSPKG